MLHAGLCVFASQLASIHSHVIGMKWSFLLQESTDQKYLWVCLQHSIVISLVSEYPHYPWVIHLFTHQGISLGQKIAHAHHLVKHLMGQVVYTFLGKKEHILLQLKVILCSAA